MTAGLLSRILQVVARYAAALHWAPGRMSLVTSLLRIVMHLLGFCSALHNGSSIHHFAQVMMGSLRNSRLKLWSYMCTV